MEQKKGMLTEKNWTLIIESDNITHQFLLKTPINLFSDSFFHLLIWYPIHVLSLVAEVANSSVVGILVTSVLAIKICITGPWLRHAGCCVSGICSASSSISGAIYSPARLATEFIWFAPVIWGRMRSFITNSRAKACSHRGHFLSMVIICQNGLTNKGAPFIFKLILNSPHSPHVFLQLVWKYCLYEVLAVQKYEFCPPHQLFGSDGPSEQVTMEEKSNNWVTALYRPAINSDSFESASALSCWHPQYS